MPFDLHWRIVRRTDEARGVKAATGGVETFALMDEAAVFIAGKMSLDAKVPDFYKLNFMVVPTPVKAVEVG